MDTGSTSDNTATDIDNSSMTSSISSQSTSTIPIEPTTTINICFPGKFPFFDICIEYTVNGAVLITAFSLSILSFIGIIIAVLYILIFRKNSSRKKTLKVTTSDTPKQETMKLSPIIDNKRSSSLHNRQQDSRKDNPIQIKSNHNEITTTTTITRTNIGRVQQLNVLEKQPVANNAIIKQRYPPIDRSKSNQQRKTIQPETTTVINVTGDNF